MQEQQVANWYQTVDWQSVIDRIANSLGTNAEYLWTVLIEGTVVDGMASLIINTTMIVIGIILGVWGYKSTKNMPWQIGNTWDDTTYLRLAFTGIVPIFLAIIFISVNLSGLKENIMKVGAPEYKAIEFLITEAKR
jgi:hypothetical protein